MELLLYLVDYKANSVTGVKINIELLAIGTSTMALSQYFWCRYSVNARMKPSLSHFPDLNRYSPAEVKSKPMLGTFRYDQVMRISSAARMTSEWLSTTSFTS
ncbi:unnamed protein product [Phytophthora fragariaefolia]|uniref:Unnamed protein product n=1 Tax=Phytophthora fragariaefolia TaxID=1490495 RepID=A0A9W6YLM1_9STRA|nr:unnamed protein product [Phytophthora fragariaefolia]